MSGEDAPAPGAGFLPFRFFAAIRDLCFHPSRFFAERAQGIVAEGGLSAALAFALLAEWLASFFNFVWRTMAGTLVQRHMSSFMQIAGDVMDHQDRESIFQSLETVRTRAHDFLFGAGTLLLSPFLTLLKLSVVALFVHAAVRFFFREHADRPHSYSATLKVLAYATAPAVLAVVPVLGVLAAWILSFIIAVVGLRDVYRSTSARAAVAVLFPELLVLGVLAAAAFFVFVAGTYLAQLLS